MPDRRRLPQQLILLAMPPVILALHGLSLRVGASPVLLVIWAACAFAVWTPRTAALAVLLVNAAYYVGLRRTGIDSPSSISRWTRVSTSAEISIARPSPSKKRKP